MKEIGLRLCKSLSLFLLLCGFVTSCAPTSSSLRVPPENYKGPLAEGPILQAGDYWVYEQGDGRKVKLGAGTLLSNLGFPLWVGKTWSYHSGSLLIGQPQTSMAHRAPVLIECTATAFNQIMVAAGTFGAFECKCQCTTLQANYEPDCGTWTIWYAPQVKNIIKIKAQSTTASVELLEYRVADGVSSKVPGPIPRECQDPEGRKRYPVLCRGY
jgi:hypothetical protein